MGMVLNTNKAALQAQRSLEESRVEMEKAMAVSYTHLTLPTSDLV